MVEYAKAVRLKINGDKSRREINTTDTYVGLRAANSNNG